MVTETTVERAGRRIAHQREFGGGVGDIPDQQYGPVGKRKHACYKGIARADGCNNLAVVVGAEIRVDSAVFIVAHQLETVERYRISVAVKPEIHDGIAA